MEPLHSCMFNHELLVAYASRSVTPSERVTVESHLARCSACQREVRELEKTWLALDVWNENVETAQPRLNDLRLRIQAVLPQPTLWEQLGHFWTRCLTPLRLLPATPALAVFLTGLLAYTGWYSQTQSQRSDLSPSIPSSRPIAEVQSVSSQASQKLSSPATMQDSNNPLPANQVANWDNLARDSFLKNSVHGSIRLVTDGILHLANFGYTPSRDIFPETLPFQPLQQTLNPATVQMMGSDFVRLK